MAVVDFPAGMTTVTVTGTLSSLGRARTGTVRVFAERKFGYIGTDWMMDEVSPPIRLENGRFALRIPHSNQPGLIGDNGAAVTNIAYKIVFQPDQSGPAETKAWTLLPVSLGPGPVPFSTLADLNGWPNAVIVTLPPSEPGEPGIEAQLVETYPGSRIFKKAV
jgi:hypothetical protein